jgi:hypothetical protein
MIEDWIVVTSGVVAVIVVIMVAFLKLRSAERRMHESSYKLKVYTDLLNAITELNLAVGDPYKMDIAKKNLAVTLNRLNLVGSSGVLKSTSDLLDFLNEYRDKDFDTVRLHNILNTIVIEARRTEPETCQASAQRTVFLHHPRPGKSFYFLLIPA